LFGGETGVRKLPGLGAGFETTHSKMAQPDEVRRVDEADMVRGCRLLARREGLLVGASTGAVLAAIGQDIGYLPNNSVVAMLVHDSGTPYLPTVFDDAWVGREIEHAARALELSDSPWPFGHPVQAGVA
jgi:cysteine synthase A